MSKISVCLFIVFFISGNVLSQQIYQNDKYHFRLTLPDEWKISEDTSIAVTATNGKSAEINMVINEQESYGKNSIEENGLEEFINSITAQFENTLKDYKTINYGKMRIDNINAYYLYYSFGEKNSRLKGSEYFCVPVSASQNAGPDLITSFQERASMRIGFIVPRINSEFAFKCRKCSFRIDGRTSDRRIASLSLDTDLTRQKSKPGNFTAYPKSSAKIAHFPDDISNRGTNFAIRNIRSEGINRNIFISGISAEI